MNKIIIYLFDMISYMLLIMPIYLIIRGFYLKRKKQKINWYHEIGLLGFILFIFGLFSQTIILKVEYGINGFRFITNGIHRTNLIPGRVFIEFYYKMNLKDYLNYFIINFLGNIILFIPIGFLLPLLWNLSNKKVIITGFLISFFIEFCQLFLPRWTDVDDLILNTFGSILGLLLYNFLSKKYLKLKYKFK